MRAQPRVPSLRFHQVKPVAALASHVKCIWTLEGLVTGGQSERVLPDGCTELLFHYGDRFSVTRNGNAELQSRGFVFGQITSSIELQPGANVGIVAVRFLPNGLQPFVGLPLHELTDRWIDLRDVWGKPWRELEQCLGDAADNAERIARVQKFLLKRLTAVNASFDYLVDTCVSRIVTSGGKASIDGLTNGFKVSYRQMERRFTAAVGLHPKTLSKIVRFQNTLKLGQQPYINSLNGLAYEAGYCDYAHMSRDFKTFVGKTPGHYFATHQGMARLLANES